MKYFGIQDKKIQYADRPSSYGIVQSKLNEIAIVNHKNRYFLPGGGMEKGETREQSLKREFLEELGWQVEVEDFLETTISFVTIPEMQKSFRIEAYFYRITQFFPKLCPKETDHRLCWKNPRITAKILWPIAHRYIVKKYFT